MNPRPGFMLYFELAPALSAMDDREAGLLFKALMAYAQYGEVRELTGLAAFAFEVVRPRIDRDAEAYREKCRKNAYNAYLRVAKLRGENPVDYEDWDGAVGSDRYPTQRSSNNNDKNNLSATQQSAGRAAAEPPPQPGSDPEWMRKYMEQRDRELNRQRAAAER